MKECLYLFIFSMKPVNHNISMLPSQQANNNNDVSRTLAQRPERQFGCNKSAVAQRARCKEED